MDLLSEVPARRPDIEEPDRHVAHAVQPLERAGGGDATAVSQRSMLWRLLRTPHDVVPLVLRLTLGVVMFPHGAQKMLGWFGGPGFQGEIAALQQHLGMPPLLTVLVIVAEFFGSLGLVAGFLTRLSALGIGAVMVGAVALEHLPFGFFMNWFGTQAGEGFEYHLLAIGLALALVIRGGGAWSVDGALAQQQDPPR